MDFLLVNGSGDCYQGDPLQEIKRFVKIAGIPTLEKFFQEDKEGGTQAMEIFYQEICKMKKV